MADEANDLFIFGDDFEAILDILERDEGLEEQFESAVSEVSVKRFIFGLIEAISYLYKQKKFCQQTGIDARYIS